MSEGDWRTRHCRHRCRHRQRGLPRHWPSRARSTDHPRQTLVTWHLERTPTKIGILGQLEVFASFFLLFRSDRRNQMCEELAAAQQWIRDGKRVVLAGVTRVVGSAPRPVGSAMVINSTDQFLGSVSGGCVEGAIIQTSERVLHDGKAIMLDLSGDGDPLT